MCVCVQNNLAYFPFMHCPVGTNRTVHWSIGKIKCQSHKHILPRGSGGGQVVRVIAFFFVNPSSNPAEVCNFCKIIDEKPKKRPWFQILASTK